MAFLFIITLGASSLVVSYQQAARREKEEQLLFAGDQIRRAILDYYSSVPPGGSRSLPPSLEALLVDQRFVVPRQHIRRLYADPVTGHPDWEPVLNSSGIIGVRSRSQQRPLKVSGFPSGYQQFESASSYSDWIFSIRP